MRALKVTLALALVVSAVAAAVVMAQGTPPTVAVVVNGNGNFAVTGADALRAGPTEFALRNATRRDQSLVLVLLKPGVTVEQFTAAARRVRDDPTPLYGLGSFETGAGLTPRGTYATTITLKEGTYVFYDITRQARQGPSFTVGAGPNGATAQQPDATIRMRDYRFSMPSRLSRTGRFRFTNVGQDPHFAVAFLLKRSARTGDFVRALRRGQDRRIEDDIAGASELVGLVSPGTTNDITFRFNRRGRYVMACFFADRKTRGREHTRLGMVRGFQVR